MRIKSVGHAVFAATMIALGILGVIKGDFAPIWQPPISRTLPAREGLAYVCALISLACGIGLFVQRAAAIASRTLLVYLLIWLIVFRLPRFFIAPTSQDTLSGFAETGAIVAGAWVLYAWFARRSPRIATILYCVALIIFGEAHFRYLKDTASLVPEWLPWHMFWAAFFGCTFIAAGIALLSGVYARWAAMLSAVQLGLFTLLVWVPALAKGPDAFQSSEFFVSWTVTAAAWAVADSYGK